MASKDTTLASRREKLEEDLRIIQKQIYDLEEVYLAETGYGNIIKGWDTFVSTTDIRAAASSRKAKVSDRDRIFTLSSVNYTPESEIPEMEDDDLGGGDEGIGNKRKRLGRYYD